MFPMLCNSAVLPECPGVTGVLRSLRSAPFLDRSANRLKVQDIDPSLRSLCYFYLAILASFLAHDADADTLFEPVKCRLSALAVDSLSVFEPRGRRKVPISLFLLRVEQQACSGQLFVTDGFVIVAHHAGKKHCRDVAANPAKPAHDKGDLATGTSPT